MRIQDKKNLRHRYPDLNNLIKTLNLGISMSSSLINSFMGVVKDRDIDRINKIYSDIDKYTFNSNSSFFNRYMTKEQSNDIIYLLLLPNTNRNVPIIDIDYLLDLGVQTPLKHLDNYNLVFYTNKITNSVLILNKIKI